MSATSLKFLLTHNELLVMQAAIEYRAQWPSYASHAIRKQSIGNTPLADELAAKRRGQGMDLVDIRAYQPGDDVRVMDWHATARCGRPYIKVFEESYGQETCVLVQQDESMLFGSQGALKAVTAARCAALLAFSAQKKQIPVGGGVVRDHGVDYYAPSLQAAQVFHFVTQCAQGRGYAEKEGNGTFSAALHSLQTRVAKETHIVVICDFLQGLKAKDRQAFTRLRRYNTVTVLQTVDPLDVALPKAGRLMLDIKGEGRVSINTDDDRVRQAYAEDMAAKMTALRRFFAGIGANVEFIYNHKDALSQLAPLL